MYVHRFNSTCWVPSFNYYYFAYTLASLRDQFGLVELDTLIYAIGGYNGGKRLNCIEAYNPRTKIWKKVSTVRSHFHF